MQGRSKVQCLARIVGILLIAIWALVSTTLAEEFRVQIPALAGTYAYGQSHGPAPFDLRCSLASVTAARVEFTGSYTMGWWDGDDVEDYYHGPKGGSARFELNHAAPSYLRWVASVHFGTNGSFSYTITFRPGSQADWKFLEHGTADLYADHDTLIGWGYMSIPPELALSPVTLVVEGERLFKILSLSRDGTLSWSPMPAGGVIRVYSAPELTGPWSIAATTPSSNTFCNLTLAPGGSAAFFRAVYSNQ